MEVSEQFAGTGRRKRAVARVKLTLGGGVITVNGKPADDYFGRSSLLQVVRQPLEVTQTGSRFDVLVNAAGGGISGRILLLRAPATVYRAQR